MFFATLSSKNTGSALPIRIILEILTVSNVYRLHALKFVHAWHKGILPELINHFVQYASNIRTKSSDEWTATKQARRDELVVYWVFSSNDV